MTRKPKLTRNPLGDTRQRVYEFVRRRILVVDVVAVDGDLVSRLEERHSGSYTENYTGGIAAEDVMVEVVTPPES